MLEFGMPTLIENKTLEDNIALCKKMGLSFVELNMNFLEYQIECCRFQSIGQRCLFGNSTSDNRSGKEVRRAKE